MTVIADKSMRDQLNEADLNNLADILKKIKFGNMASVVKVVATGLTAAASFDITTAAVKAASVISGLSLLSGENLPAIGVAQSLRVTASGTGTTVGNYIAGDVGSTMVPPPGGANVAVGVARISDDGKTLTFPTTVTAFTLIYIPRAAVALTSELPASAP